MKNETVVRFVTRTNGPERVVCEAELHFGAAAGPVAGAEVRAYVGRELYAAGRTDDAGTLATQLPAGTFDLRVASPGRGSAAMTLEGDGAGDRTVVKEQGHRPPGG